MINVWWFTRPKRRVTGIPNIIASVVSEVIGQKWSGERNTHLSVESALEKEGLKRIGDRRDQSGSGARTYLAWLRSYGFIFEYNKQLEFTLAAEDILNGASPVEVMRAQVLKYQFPSNFSTRQKSEVAPRFKIRPYRFVLKLLKDPVLKGYLTEDEIAFILIEEAENESDSCYRKVVNHILDYRDRGSVAIPSIEELNRLYRDDNDGKIGYFTDIANTMVNVFEYTQLVYRTITDEGKNCIKIATEASEYVDSILSTNPAFIDRPEDEVYFQRKYGVGPFHKKDTRNLAETRTITPKILMETNIKKSFIKLSLQEPIYRIDSHVIDMLVADNAYTYTYNQVEDVVREVYPGGAINGFLSNYYQMAFSGTQLATEFEKATAAIFHDVFNFETEWIGSRGNVPDVVISTDDEGYQAIIDTKAYNSYSITNDHFNRMTYNYIPKIYQYSFSRNKLVAFAYIAGGFNNSVEKNLRCIEQLTHVKGSAFTVNAIIQLVEKALENPIPHKSWRQLLSSGKVISSSKGLILPS